MIFTLQQNIIAAAEKTKGSSASVKEIKTRALVLSLVAVEILSSLLGTIVFQIPRTVSSLFFAPDNNTPRAIVGQAPNKGKVKSAKEKALNNLKNAYSHFKGSFAKSSDEI